MIHKSFTNREFCLNEFLKIMAVHRASFIPNDCDIIVMKRTLIKAFLNELISY